MKKIIYILTIALSLSCASCNDILETTSPSEFTSDVVFSTVAYTEYAITGIYNLMLQDHTYSARLPLNWSTNSDIEFVGADAATYNQNSNRGVSNYYGTSDNSHFVNTWTYLYRMIERSNLAIDGIQKSSLFNGSDQTASDRMHAYLGEALTLRALAYFELVKNFGDVPFKKEPTLADGSNIYLPVTDRDVIYDEIIKDLQEAIGYLPWVKQGQYTSVERVTKGFSKGLLARVALFRGGYSIRNKAGFPTERGSDWEKYYEIANTQCREIMESGVHQLNPSYVNVWKMLNSLQLDGTYNENLFEVALGLGQNGEMGYSAGVRFYANAKYGYGNNSNVINTSVYYYYMFDKSDLRRDVTIANYSYGNSSGETKEFFQSNPLSYNIGKWDQRWMSSQWLSGNLAAAGKRGYGINWAIMRYSDVLLMFAETENELNGSPTNEAKEALKKVRSRAFSSENQIEKVEIFVNSLNNHNDFFNAIVDERAYEFGGESIRKYDLIRWNLLESKIQEQRNVLAQMFNSGTHPKYGQLPTKLYYKYESNNENIDKATMNFYNELETAPEGFTSTPWLGGASETNKIDWLNRVELFSSGLSNNSAGVKNRHLYPIPTSVISESQGLLSNSYGFN